MSPISARFLRQQSPRLSRKAIIKIGIGSHVPFQVPSIEEVAPRLIGVVERLEGVVDRVERIVGLGEAVMSPLTAIEHAVRGVVNTIRERTHI